MPILGNQIFADGAWHTLATPHWDADGLAILLGKLVPGR
jgi:hypothetical protein